MSVARAADQTRQALVCCAHRGRIMATTVLGDRPGIGLRVKAYLHAEVELDTFGEEVRCLFRDRMMDLEVERVFRLRETSPVDARGRPVGDVHELTHIPTGVPVTLSVARSNEEWDRLTS